MIGTMLPAIEFSGLINPVSALQGIGRMIGEAYPASHMLTITRDVFDKVLGLAGLAPDFAALLVAAPLILLLAVAVLPKQER